VNHPKQAREVGGESLEQDFSQKVGIESPRFNS